MFKLICCCLLLLTHGSCPVYSDGIVQVGQCGLQRSSSVSVKVHTISLLVLLIVSFIIQSKQMEKRRGESKNPCFTPMMLESSSVRLVPQMTHALKLVYSILMIDISFSGIP